MNSEIRRITQELASRAKVVEVAQKLGMVVSNPRSGQPKTLCPFHDDRTPSLTLYQGHYHCFACNAHGNVYELVKAVRKVPFAEARNWLAYEYGVPLKPSTLLGSSPKHPGILDLELAFEKYQHQTPVDMQYLNEWALSRDFKSAFLNSVEVFGAKGNKLSRSFKMSEDFEELDSLVEAGLVYQSKSNLDLTNPYYDIFYSDRIVFTIRTSLGEIAGFSGRAIGDDTPKDLFSKGLPKGKLLYRLYKMRDKILAKSKLKDTETIHLYLVEGPVDVLRFESLGFFAVGILGCSEYRRRKILEKVLQACGIFKVDILVLPEYSVRPETVEWIANKLPDYAHETSVWAGTFRKPPYMAGNCASLFKSAPDWAAPLPVVMPNNPTTGPGLVKLTRRKKYPAAGLGEIFNPYSQEIKPISWELKKEMGFGDYRDLVCELICSEIFQFMIMSLKN